MISVFGFGFLCIISFASFSIKAETYALCLVKLRHASSWEESLILGPIGGQMFSCLHVSGVPLVGWVVGSTKQEDGQGKQRGVRAKYSCNQRLTRAYLRLHLSVIQLIRACPDLGRSHLKIPSPLPPALTVPPSREKTLWGVFFLLAMKKSRYQV